MVGGILGSLHSIDIEVFGMFRTKSQALEC